MRIVHVNTEPTWRGGESQVFNLMHGLRRLGHDVEAIALPGGALAQRCSEAGLPVVELRMRSDADLPAAMRIASYLRRAPCDVLHAQTSRAHSIALLARTIGARAKLVVSRRLDFPIARNPANLWKYRNPRVDGYIAVAGVIRDILVDAGVEPARVTVINSSIDLKRFDDAEDHGGAVRAELGIPRDAPLVGNVAALAWHKGQKDLIAAMPHLLRVLPAAWLAIVGGGEERQALEALASRLGVAGRIVFTGARADVPRLLTAFDAFCMSSHREGLCNSVLEAFASRVPVVATRAGGLPEIVTNEVTGLLVSPRDPPHLAEALARVLTDPALAARLAEGGHRLVRERFGVERMVQATEAYYETLARARAAAS